MTRANPSLFRPDTFDLLAGEFATNLSYYRNYTDDDVIAGMFLGCALDILDCTYYTFAKSLPTEKQKIIDSFTDSWREDVFGTQLFNDILDPELAVEVVAQHHLLLEALRERYQWLIRGPLPICWQEATASMQEKGGTCRSRSRCCPGKVGSSGLARMCATYFSSWSETMLAMDDSEELRNDPAALSLEIRRRCRVLALLTLPENLREYLERHYGKDSPAEEKRTVRGVIPRLLTLLVDESLDDLSRRMQLPPGESLYFSPPQPRA